MIGQFWSPFEDKSWVVRGAAAEALGHAADDSDIDKLLHMLEKKNPSVRYKAAATILRLTTK